MYCRSNWASRSQWKEWHSAPSLLHGETAPFDYRHRPWRRVLAIKFCRLHLQFEGAAPKISLQLGHGDKLQWWLNDNGFVLTVNTVFGILSLPYLGAAVLPANIRIHKPALKFSQSVFIIFCRCCPNNAHYCSAAHIRCYSSLSVKTIRVSQHGMILLVGHKNLPHHSLPQLPAANWCACPLAFSTRLTCTPGPMVTLAFKQTTRRTWV